MFVDGVNWKKESGKGIWRGSVEAWDSIQAFVMTEDDPARFTATVYCRGTTIHTSEHFCLCRARRAGSRAMKRAHALRKDWP